MTYQFNDHSPLWKHLQSSKLFRKTGLPLENSKFHVVVSWEQAFEMVEHEVQLWCSVEARNMLYAPLSEEHVERFNLWNEVARSYVEPVSRFVAHSMKTPGIPPFPSPAKDWMNGILIGAFMEEEYEDCINVTLYRDLVDVLIDGHFPCGWYCRAAADFPLASPIIVY
ncbi:hypothetical protein [Schlesneria paludicola]|uniref:hypothetical protein n=1 Tax=Schlesneria paludicola TaxID=360056 RepID=UPI00029AC542|nr:hypothetical protein [Schlesneria paludicola]